MEADQHVDFFAQADGFQRHEENTEADRISTQGKSSNYLLTPTQSQQTTRQTAFNTQLTTDKSTEIIDPFLSETVSTAASRQESDHEELLLSASTERLRQKANDRKRHQRGRLTPEQAELAREKDRERKRRGRANLNP